MKFFLNSIILLLETVKCSQAAKRMKIEPRKFEKIMKSSEYLIGSTETTFSVIRVKVLNELYKNSTSFRKNVKRKYTMIERECAVCQKNLCEENTSTEQNSETLLVVSVHKSEKHNPSYFHLRCFYDHLKNKRNCPCCNKEVKIAEPLLKQIGISVLSMIDGNKIEDEMEVLEILTAVYESNMEETVSLLLSENFKMETLDAIIEISMNNSGEYILHEALNIIRSFKTRTGDEKLVIPPGFINSRNTNPIYMIISQQKQLKSLDLSGNSISIYNIEKFSKMIEELTDLEELNLSNNMIENFAIRTISPGLQKLPKLAKLDLSNNLIDCDGILLLLSTLKKLGNLTWLNLAGNILGVDGAKEFSAALKKLSNLESLDISKNFIRDDGAEMIGGVLAEMRNLVSFSISQNSISIAGAIEIAKGLEKSEKLEHLDFSRNMIDANCVECIDEFLSKLPKLRVLKLEGNVAGEKISKNNTSNPNLQITYSTSN